MKNKNKLYSYIIYFVPNKIIDNEAKIILAMMDWRECNSRFYRIFKNTKKDVTNTFNQLVEVMPDYNLKLKRTNKIKDKELLSEIIGQELLNIEER